MMHFNAKTHNTCLLNNISIKLLVSVWTPRTFNHLYFLVDLLRTIKVDRVLTFVFLFNCFATEINNRFFVVSLVCLGLSELSVIE